MNLESSNARLLLDTVCRDEDEVIAAFGAWIGEEPRPDDWHRFAMGANWDFVPPELLHWIVLQADCDRATAMLLFWKSSPDYYVAFGGDRESIPEFNRSGFDLSRLIRDRWLGGAYRRAELAFERETDSWPLDFAGLEREFGDRVEAEMPSSMRMDLPGRRLTTDGCVDGIPLRFWPEDLG